MTIIKYMPPLSAYIFLHCERHHEIGLFKEPLNTLSNFGFFIAAYLLFKLIRKREHQPLSTYWLIALLVVIGIGSITFHMTAKMWAAALCDVLPIAIFAVSFMYLYSRHILRFNSLQTALMVAIFCILNIGFKHYILHGGRAPDGYVSLIPTAFFLILLCIYMLTTKNISACAFIKATSIAVIAIFFRALDTPDCTYFPYGTHFLWHSLMAVFMYVVVAELIRRHRLFDVAPATL